MSKYIHIISICPTLNREGEGSQDLSDTLRNINLVELDLDLVPWCGPMSPCECVIEECGDGEVTGSKKASVRSQRVRVRSL